MKVSLTGTLEGLKRKEAIALIESVGAEYSKGVTYDTNYLVATKLDSSKAVRAREIGVEVITQSEFEDFIEQGNFPENDLPEKRYINRVNNFPKFDWVKIPDNDQKIVKFEYFDGDGVVTIRNVIFIAIAEYKTSKGINRTYYSGIDIDDERSVKTFRSDRIINHDAIL